MDELNRSDEPGTPGLSPADIAAIDHLAEEGFDPNQLHGLEGEALARAQAANALLTRLEAYPDGALAEDDCTTLVHATMARIRREESLQRDRMRLQPGEAAGRGSRMRFRLAEFGAVAAVAVVGWCVGIGVVGGPGAAAVGRATKRSTPRHAQQPSGP